jgi:hypothetical protein
VEASSRTGRRRRLWAGAIFVVAIALGVAAWLFVRNHDHGGTATPTTTGTRSARSVVVRARPRSLVALSRLLRQPIYWAGPEPRTKLELTQTPSRRVYVRYLPLNVPIGERRGSYLVIGTYRVKNAYKAIKRASREVGAHLLRLRGGLIGVYNDDLRTNVYFAARHSNYQVEVYDPNPAQALALVESGRVRPISSRAARR